MHICLSLSLFCIRMAGFFFFYNSEVMTSFPHNLLLDSQPRFGLTQFEFLNLYNFLINSPIFMKIVAKCSDFLSLSYQVQEKVCSPIPLTKTVLVG